ncbi:MAG TPA: SPOR domain-containing protein [Acidocella sp.]|nr:SPOR domain-containing protein [Acidocella sp.]
MQQHNDLQDDDGDFFYQPQRAAGQRLDPAITRMALGAGGVTILVILVAFAWSGFHSGGFGPPPVINPPDLPLRMAPASPGGLVVPGADVPIMSGQDDNSAPPQLAPQGQGPDVAQLDQAAGLNQPPPAPPAAAPAATPPGATATAPAQPGQPASQTAAEPASATANPPSPVPGVQPPAPAQIQLAAVADEGKAEAAWTQAAQKAPDLLGSKSPIILPAVVNGQSVWRVRVAGFASAADAKNLCAALTAKGVACLVPGP